ncbi:MAG: hypothetical protein JWQ62_1037, partial [Lacunisphaera sp.]|nr:hypothetical protein [Lacunisphaera sp.]
ALVTASLPALVVCTLNKRHYGWFGTCEFRSTQFQDAYGAMLRVRVGPELPHVPVTREARIAMARVSPRFAEVQQKLEGGVAQGWAGASEFFTHLPPAAGQVGGGWFMWAFREATAQAGYHKSAALALDFYRKLARELNRACDEGRLSAGPERSGFMPRWQGGDTGPFLLTTWEFADFVVRFSRFSGRPPPSSGAPEDLQLFRDITRERLSPPEGELDVVGADRYLLNLWKADVLHRVGKALRPFLTGLFVLAQILAVVRVGWMLARRRWSYPLTVATAAWGACLASVAMHAVIEVTSFPVLTVTSFAPIYPLLLVFVVAIFWDVAVAWRNRPGIFAASVTSDLPALQPVLPAVPRTRFERMLPWVLGLAALLPFVIWQRAFRELCWFGDDFFLLDQWAQMGLRKWSTVAFAENFVPVFKFLWAGGVAGLGGSYAAMLGLLWLTHALNTTLFVRLLQRVGLSPAATLVAALVFALTPINLETLGWSVQWSALLATTFLLFALAWLERHDAAASRWHWRIHVPLMLLVAASAGSFSRGVLTGAVVALGLLLPALRRRDWREAARRLPGAVACLLPAVAVAVVIKLNASGNHQQLTGHGGAMLVFGASYFLLNPVTDLLHFTSLHPVLLGLVAAGKIAVIAAALRLARGRVWQLLVLLLAYDLGNAVLLGIGRYHTGFAAALSSRYQYSSLLAFLPFVGVLVGAIPERRRGPAAARWAALGVFALGILWSWPAELAEFTRERGTEVRRLLAAPAVTDPAVMTPGLEFMHIERAKALQRAYGLH